MAGLGPAQISTGLRFRLVGGPDRLALAAPGFLAGGLEVFPRDLSIGVVRAKEALEIGQAPLVERDGLVDPPGRVVIDGEIVPRDQDRGVVRVEHPLEVGQAALVQRDGLVQPAGRG